MLKECFQREVPEAGCDEAGRGCLAGPVFAAAVILPPGFAHPLLNDSKKMSEKNRYLMRDVILRDAVAWAVAEVSPDKHPERLFRRHVAGRGAALLPARPAADRRQQIPEHARYPVRVHRGRRRPLCLHCSRIGIGQDFPRRQNEAAA